ncbi:MAG: AAA family ATPase [Acidobacteriota bacterium]
MPTPRLAGLQLGERIHRGRRSVVYRARSDDGRDRIVKLLGGERPPPEDIAWFRREYAMLRHLDSVDGVVDAIALHHQEGRWLLVQEDLGATSLDRLWSHRPAPTHVALNLAIGLAEILAAVHGRGVIHKDLNPSNIVYERSSRRLQIIDFGIASRLLRERPDALEPSHLEGTLQSIAPEQTGRTGWSVDERADLYAFGVTLYQLLTGRPPFDSADPLDLLHGHLARRPVPPDELEPDLDPRLAAIVLRLLAKNPDDRYQSAHGLRHDLLACTTPPTERTHFVPGAHDVPMRLRMPQRLFGRERELEQLLRAFDVAAEGGRSLALVAGYAGIGKSSLVSELRQPVIAQGGLFARGKFSHLGRHLPYAPWITAFRGLLDQVLAFGTDRLETFRQGLLSTLGGTAGALIDVVPELEVLLGEVPAAAELGPVATRNRFHLAVQRFVAALTAGGRPVVLFLDDVQWADISSLELLESLLGDRASGHLMVVAAYRLPAIDDDEDDQPLRRLLDRSSASAPGLQVEHLALRALNADDTARLLAEALASRPERTRDLATVVCAKSGGNPLFLGRLLEQLTRDGLLRLDAENGHWSWDVEQIAACELTDHVATLLADTVHSLAAETREILELAACCGDVFDLRTLAIIAEKPPHVVARHLDPALEHELVVPLDRRYKLADLEVDGLDLGLVAYRFAHDRVRQAAYTSIEPSTRRRVHWRIGRLLHDRTPAARYDERLFDMVDQLGLGLHHGLEHASASEREQAASLHLRAGRRARTAAAHQAAFVYLRRGVVLLAAGPHDADRWPCPESMAGAWRRRPELCLDLLTTTAEAALIAGEADDLDRLLAMVREHITSDLLEARLTSIEIQSLVARGALDEALDVGLATLQTLGLAMPREPSREHIRRATDELDAVLETCDLDALARAPAMRDPRALAALDVGANLHEAALQKDADDLRDLLTVRLAQLCLTHGPAAYAPRCIGAAGLRFCARGDLTTARSLARLALEIGERFESTDLPRALLFNLMYRFPRREPLDRCFSRWPDLYELALQSGDLSIGHHTSFLWHFWLLAFRGDLRQLTHRLETVMQGPQSGGRQGFLHRLVHEVVVALQDNTTRGGIQTALDALETQADPVTLHRPTHAVFDWIQLMTRVLFAADDRAFTHRCAALTNSVARGVVVEAVPAFYGCLSLLRGLPLGHPVRTEDARQIEAWLKVLHEWAAIQPSFRHKLALIAAEQARIAGRSDRARDLYDEAIVLAREHGIVHEEALAHELAAAFHRAAGRPHLAHNYLRDACRAYASWGAHAKVRQLEDRFPHELAQPDASSRLGVGSSTGNEASDALDLHAVLAASRALSGELDLDKLLVRLLTTALSASGAQRVVLLREHEAHDGLVVEAEAEARDGDLPPIVHADTPVPLARYDRLLASVVYRVARTGERQVIADAQHERFASEPHHARGRPRAVLCMPLVHQGRRAAILYLENSLVPGAFHHERVELLEVLAGEMAITLDNAHLVRTLEAANRELDQRVRERTRDLAARNRELNDTVERLQETREQLVHREKMAALGRMAAGVAHEIRNPLNFVTNFARLGAELAAGCSSIGDGDGDGDGGKVTDVLAELHDITTRIESHGRRAARIVDGMLLQVRAPESERMQTDVNRLVAQAVELMRHSLRAGEREMPAAIDERYDEATGSIDAFPHELLRVVVNLLENAVDSTRELRRRGEVERLPSITVHTEGHADRVVVRVRDTGLGLAAEQVDRLFEPFFTTKPPGQGTGLGLAMSYETVQKHGGTIVADGREGEFAELTIELPRTA